MSITHHGVLQMGVKGLFSVHTQITLCHQWKVPRSNGQPALRGWHGAIAGTPRGHGGPRARTWGPWAAGNMCESACESMGAGVQWGACGPGLLCIPLHPPASLCGCITAAAGAWAAACVCGLPVGRSMGVTVLAPPVPGARCPLSRSFTRCCGPASPCPGGRARTEGGMERRE